MLLFVFVWLASFIALPQVLAGDLSARMGKAVEDLRFDDCDKLTAGTTKEFVLWCLLLVMWCGVFLLFAILACADACTCDTSYLYRSYD